MPAPLTTFPLGYPLLVTAFSATGLQPEMAGLMVSVLATMLCVACLAAIGRRLDFSPAVIRCLMAAFIFDSLVVETGLYNLTNDEVPVLAHFGAERREHRTLIRLQQPESQEPQQ